MNRIKIMVLSLCALVFVRAPGFCTANAGDTRPLEDRTVDELKELAASRNIEITSSMKKADIIEALGGTQPLADKVEDVVLGKPVVDNRPLDVQVAELKAQLAAVRSSMPVPPVLIPTVNSSTTLLIQGAGVSVDDVAWRIRAGLDPAQAVEVAIQEKNEREAKK